MPFGRRRRPARPAPPIASIFLSYSGDDEDAADAVVGSLENRGHRIWRFTAQTRGGEDWRREMIDQVVRSDVVVYLASRSSVGSGYCREELTAAQEHHRRVVVVRLAPDLRGSELPPQARFIRWIDLADGTEFSDALHTAVITNFDLLHAVAGLDERATDWEKTRRPPRLLARGGELRGFEKLLTAVDAGPAAPGLVPTETTRIYVERSRARQRARTVVGSAVVAVAALIAIGLIALNARRADERERSEVAAVLLDRAVDARFADPQRALQLGIAADRIHPDARTRAGLVGTMTSTRYRGSIEEKEAVFAAHRPLLATAGDGIAQLWDVSDPAGAVRLGTVPTADGTDPTAMSFTPDGETLAVAGADGRVSLYDTGAALAGPGGAQPLGVPTDPRTQAPGSFVPADAAVAFSPDGRLMLVATGDEAPQLWDVAAHRRVITLSGHTAGVTRVAFTADGTTAATGDDSGTTVVWDVRDPEAPKPFGPPLAWPGAPIAGLAFAGDVLAVGSYRHGVRLWDVGSRTSPQLRHTLESPTPDVSALASSPVAPLLALGALDGTTTLWDVTDPGAPRQKGRPMAGRTEPVRSVSFSGDGRLVASGGDEGTSLLWTVDDTAEPHVLGPPVDSGNSALSFVAFAADGRTAAMSVAGRSAGLFDVSVPAAPRALEGPVVDPDVTVFDAAFSPTAPTLATASDTGVTLWDVSQRDDPRRLATPPVDGFTTETVSVRFSPDGRLLAAVVSDGTARLWDVSDPTDPRVLGTPLEGKVASVAFSADGRTLATGSYVSTVTLYDIADPAAPRVTVPALQGHPEFRGVVASLAFSRDDLLASGSDNGTVILWNVHDRDRPSSVGQPLDSASGAAASSVAFSPDGQLLLTADDGGAVTVLDVSDPATPVPLGQPLTAHGSGAESFAVTPDGRTLATGSYDGTVVFSDLGALLDLRDHAAARACALVGRGFTEPEWSTFVPRIPYEDTCDN